MKLEATHLHGRKWAVRPEGELGTIGWFPEPWEVIYVLAPNAQSAVRRAEQIKAKQRRNHA